MLNSIMDGLPKAPKRRKYTMTNRVPKSIIEQKIGYSRDGKCELQV